METTAIPLDPGIEFSAKLTVLPGVRHGFYARTGGASRGVYKSLNIGLGSDDDRSHILANRAAICRHLNVPSGNLATPYQAHTAHAVYVDKVWDAGYRPKADGLVTDRKGIALGVGTADCGPVLLADAGAGIIGAAHAGWKGALSGILEATIGLMEEIGANRAEIVAALGPTISQHAYEVGPEFIEQFQNVDARSSQFFMPATRVNHALFDLPGYVMMRLEEAGIEHRESLDICTYRQAERFFSYRRATHRGEPDYGRQLSAIVRAAD